MSDLVDSAIISDYVDIAQNEYVTKYSFNRNFEKLLSNDNILDSLVRDAPIETYNKLKTYNRNDLVFYKIQKTDSQFYVLRSKQTPNMHKPLVQRDINTGKLYVINGDWWEVLGALNSENDSMTPKDYADSYVSNSKKTFIDQHQDNTAPGAHPTDKLGMKESSILFRTFDNISDDRSHFHYPYELQSYVADDSVYSGYMRKWDNGLLEYDLVFKLSYAGTSDDGMELLSANNYKALKQNNNFIYFKDDEDYNIFNKGGEYYVNINGTKQVNLNKTINAYSSKIKFLEPFKDLNYMVFTSNVKNIETEAYNTKNEVIDTYDDRLILDGKTIVGTTENAAFKFKLIIPNEIVNIKFQALGYMKQSQGYPIVLNIDPNASELINIDNEAFVYSEIDTISLPYSLRYIGRNAFAECFQLTSVVFYVDRDPTKQPRIDFGAFSNSNIQSLSVIYKPQTFTSLFSSSQTMDDIYNDVFLSKDHLSEKFKNLNYLANIGILSEPTIYVENEPEAYVQPILMTTTLNDENTQEQQTLNDEDPTNNVITINIDEFLSELSSMQQQQKLFARSRSTLFGANVPIQPTAHNVFKVDGTTITGFDDSLILSNGIALNLQELANVSAIGSGALSAFDKLVSLSVGTNISSIAPDAFGYDFNELVLNANTNFNLSASSFNNLCILNPSKTLTAYSINNCYYTPTSLTNIPSYAISAQNITNLYINNISSLEASAFASVNTIDNAYIYSNNSNVKLNEFIFGLSVNSDDPADIYVENNIRNLNLIGNNWTLAPSSLMGITIDYLSIDMASSEICARAFLSGYSSTLELLNIDSAKENTTYQGLYANSLLNFYTDQLLFSNYDYISSLSSKFNFNLIRLAFPCIFTTQKESKVYSAANTWINKPNYLNITGSTLIKCINSNINSNYDVIIPNYITTINNNAFLDCTRATIIYIPASVTSIGNDAFKGCTNLEEIIFEPGIQLSSIGTNIFDNCLKLYKIKIQNL